MIALTAAAICTGTSIGTAGTSDIAGTGADVAPATADTPNSGDAYYWGLRNHTGTSIYGTWDALMASTGNSSHVKTTADHRWPPGGAAGAYMYQDPSYLTTWTGKICYNNHWWNYKNNSKGFFENYLYSLEVDSTGALFVYPRSESTRDFRIRMTLEPDSTC
ncbi:hypothetical protein R3Q06_33860 [Rhodococcus erythropolis]|uniref:hypothetical protein n=1 Tax=Rhodococcus erythropolis TaxID=1833 RepID=UPI002948D678|nr:hypothetical protein [Rhodococcus erythropolis]MDV6278413.1 hypothetical protein [Rhodococcus erythropolis]